MKKVRCAECGAWFEKKSRNQATCSPECGEERRKRQNREWYYRNSEAILAKKKQRQVHKERKRTVAPEGYIPPEQRVNNLDRLDKLILECGGTKAYEEKRKADALSRLTPIVIPKELLEERR